MAKRPPNKRKATPDKEIKAEILKVSLQVFAEKGFEGTSVRDIANRVGVAHGLLRYYHGDKAALWKRAVEFMFEQLGAEVFGAATHTGQTAIEADQFLRRYVRYCAGNPEHARIMTQENIKGSERFNWMADKFIRLMHKRVQPKLKARAKERGFSREQTVSFGYSILAACQSISLFSAEIGRVYGIDSTDARMIEAHADTVVALFSGNQP